MPLVERPQMADYGVPTDPDGALPWEWASERLVRCRNYWVVTVSPLGQPHALPVWGVWLAEREHFWFSCAPSAHKLRNLRANPRVAVTIEDTVECVSVQGSAEEVDQSDSAHADEIDQMLDAYVHKYWPDPAEHASSIDFLRSNALIRVTPRRAYGIIERADEFAARATRWRWT